MDPMGVRGVLLGLVELTTCLLDGKGVFVDPGEVSLRLGSTHGLNVHHVGIDVPSLLFGPDGLLLACCFFGLEGFFVDFKIALYMYYICFFFD